MIIKIIGIILLAAMSAVTYRMGGSGNYPRWIREFGVCTAMTFTLMLLGLFHWTLILCFGLMYASLTTYFKKKNTNAECWNWVLVGLVFSLSVLPIVITYHLWVGFFIRTFVTTIFICMWSETMGDVIWEEGGRGVIPILTLPLLLIGT